MLLIVVWIILGTSNNSVGISLKERVKAEPRKNFRKKGHPAVKFARHFSAIRRKGYPTIKPANVLIHSRVKVTDIRRREALSRFRMDISYLLVDRKMFRSPDGKRRNADSCVGTDDTCIIL